MVAAINAAIMFGMQVPKQGTEKYDALVDIAFARNGAAINIQAVLDKLRLRVVRRPLTISSIQRSLRRGRPVAISVSHKAYGMHMTTIVMTIREDGGTWVRATNFMKAAPDGWIRWSKLKKLCVPGDSFGSVGGGATQSWAWEFRRL